MVLWKYFERWTTWAKRVFRKRYTFPCYRVSQSRGSTRRPPFKTHVKPSVKRIVIFVYLNSLCYLISYTRLFTKLNLFEILFYITFLTTKFSRSTVSLQHTTNYITMYYLYLLWQNNIATLLTFFATNPQVIVGSLITSDKSNVLSMTNEKQKLLSLHTSN